MEKKLIILMLIAAAIILTGCPDAGTVINPEAETTGTESGTEQSTESNPDSSGDSGSTIETYTVSFESNGGTETATQSKDSGELVTEPSAPTMGGFIFEGWYGDSSFTTAWDFDTDTVTSDTTLYAKWDWVTYEIDPRGTTAPTGPAGGHIYYVNPDAETDGWKYLECSVSSTEWTGRVWAADTKETGATAGELGSGRQNTIDIVAALGTPAEGSEYAAYLCSELESGGYDDWFLPSIEEVKEMRDSLYGREGVSLSTSDAYWSSSEASSDSSSAKYFYFPESIEGSNSKSNTYIVRAIRMF